jgi:acyl carrier protein
VLGGGRQSAEPTLGAHPPALAPELTGSVALGQAVVGELVARELADVLSQPALTVVEQRRRLAGHGRASINGRGAVIFCARIARRFTEHRRESNPEMADIEPIRTFVRRQFLFDAEAPLADGDPLFPDVIDSLGVMEVVEFVEEHYGVTIEEDEMLSDNFRSLEAISALVDRKANAA